VTSHDSYYEEPVGNELNFEDVVHLYHAGLYLFAMSLTHNEPDACDLVQDTFLRWAEKGQQLREAGKVKSWLFTTLHHRFLELHRRVVRFPHSELSTAEGELPNIEPDLVNRLDGEHLIKLLGGVDSQFRSAVALFYLEDYSYNEIAEILEVPVGTVKSRISRGIGQLKLLVHDALFETGKGRP
jgi:RNA polymerase sigma factor (sigma-70 family)